MNLEKKLQGRDPELINLAKKVSIYLAKYHLESVEARVAVVLDASGSMSRVFKASKSFKKGKVQMVLERIALLSVHFDNNGVMDIWGFAERHKKYPDVSLDNLQGYIDAICQNGEAAAFETLPGLGSMHNEPPVINAVTDFFKDSKLPVYVVFITDGGVSRIREIKEAIQRAEAYPIFWTFAGLDTSNYGTMENLDAFTNRSINNSHFFWIDTFSSLKDDQLYQKLLDKFKEWIEQAKSEGIF